jgi:hypothetical protein
MHALLYGNILHTELPVFKEILTNLSMSCISVGSTWQPQTSSGEGSLCTFMLYWEAIAN